MANVTTQTPETMLAVIDTTQGMLPLPINSDTVVLGGPLAMSGTCNTQIDITGTGNLTEGYADVYVGRTSLQYDRLDLGLLFKGILFDLHVDPEDGIPDLHAALPGLSERYGMTFFPEDIKNISFDPPLSDKITFSATPTSLNFIGSVDLIIGSTAIDLDDLNPNLDVFKEEIKVSDFEYTEDGAPLFPVNGARLTGNDYFPQYADGLSKAIGYQGRLTPAGSELLRQILRLEYGLSVKRFNGPLINASIVTPPGKGEALLVKNLKSVDYLLFEFGERS